MVKSIFDFKNYGLVSIILIFHYNFLIKIFFDVALVFYVFCIFILNIIVYNDFTLIYKFIKLF